jgi:hypothetical protein
MFSFVTNITFDAGKTCDSSETPNSLSCSMFLQKHIATNNLLPYFLNLIAAGEGSLPDY